MRDTAPDPGSMKSASCNRVQVPENRVRTRVRCTFYSARLLHSSGLIICRDDVKGRWVGWLVTRANSSDIPETKIDYPYPLSRAGFYSRKLINFRHLHS